MNLSSSAYTSWIAIKDNLEKIICDIAKESPRAKLVAVSKYHGEDKVTESIKAGQKIFGENKVQEAKKKWPKLIKKHLDIELHLIGSLQTNKAKDAVKIFDVIEVIDRKKLADSISKEASKINKPNIECYIQVNIGDEPQKGGVLINEFDELLSYCKKTGLNITGVMCIPPAGEDPTRHFNILKNLADKNQLPNISMGMSKDYKQALKCGATHIRIGTAIFGERDYN